MQKNTTDGKKRLFNLGIPERMLHKINYLLGRFNSEEWSGPAWYEIVETTKTGFPKNVVLRFFKAIHLGSGAETEIDGDKMGKLLPKIYKKIPELKDYYLGLIHSHHTMGAFISKTDKDTALEQASKDGIFFSTIVASKNERFETCLTYKDQFGFDRLIKGATEPLINVEIDKSWQAEANYIQKMKKKQDVKKPTTTYYNGFGHLNSVGGYGNYNYGVSKYSGGTKADWDIMEELIESYEMNKITYHELLEEAKKKCPNMDIHLWVDNPHQQTIGLV